MTTLREKIEALANNWPIKSVAFRALDERDTALALAAARLAHDEHKPLFARAKELLTVARCPQKCTNGTTPYGDECQWCGERKELFAALAEAAKIGAGE